MIDPTPAATTSGHRPPPRVHHQDGRVLVTGDDYRLVIGDLRSTPWATLTDLDGRRWMQLCLVAGVDALQGADETAEVGPYRLEPETDRPDAVTIAVPQTSSIWTSKTVRIVCTARTVELALEVTGAGTLTDLTLLGGAATLDNGACGVFRTSIDVASLLVPAPTEPVRFVRPASVGAVLGMMGDADPGRLHGIFSPPPLVFGLGRTAPVNDGITPPPGPWLGMSVRERIERLTCTAVAYEPLDGGFLLRAAYEGHTPVRGSWRSPAVVLRAAADAWQVVSDHRDDLVAHACAPAAAPSAGAAWWQEPIFCGWGAQSALATANGDAAASPDLARQDHYDDWLARLAAEGVVPGTVVVDDRWQAAYGTAQPDPDRWPDLAGWIRGRHAAGMRTLLWWKAWDPAGLPADECILDPLGRPIAVDPANPAYLERLRGIVTGLVSPDGLDADGFKIDFTQRGPSGRSLRGKEGVWGMAALHRLIATLHDAAKAAKPDALVITHAVHPSFGDVADMVRMNDVLELDAAGRAVPVVDQLRVRVGIAERALPHHPIDTDQWRMPDREQWLRYVDEQPHLGVPALYYVDRIDTSGEVIPPADLRHVADTWAAYRERRRAER